MNLMADARVPSARRAGTGCRDQSPAGEGTPLTREQLARIVAFESQPVRRAGHDATRPAASRKRMAPRASARRRMQKGEAGVLGNNTTRWVIPDGEQVEVSCRAPAMRAANARNAARESIQRGHDVYMFRTFWIRDSMHLNSGGPRQSHQAHLRHLPRHAHDGHGHGQRLDGHRHHQPAVGAAKCR